MSGDPTLWELVIATTHDASDLVAWKLEDDGAVGTAVVDPFELARDIAQPASLDYAGRDVVSALPPWVEIRAWFVADGDALVRADDVHEDPTVYLTAFRAWQRTIHPPIADAPLNAPRRLAPETWRDAWKAHHDVLRLGRHLLVVPTWRTLDAAQVRPGDCLITLDAGMAFGSGSHETTALCAAALEDVVTPTSRVADVGTGSGLLAIIAKRLGAADVDAVDIDPAAVKTARDNARQNDVQIHIVQGSADALKGLYDVVVANIVYDVLLTLADTLASHLAPGGRLIVSGVLSERGDAFVAAMAAHGLVTLGRDDRGGWAMFLLRRAEA